MHNIQYSFHSDLCDFYRPKPICIAHPREVHDRNFNSSLSVIHILSAKQVSAPVCKQHHRSREDTAVANMFILVSTTSSHGDSF